MNNSIIFFSFIRFLTVLSAALIGFAADLAGENVCSSPQKVLICGVCRNVESALQNTIDNITELGNKFADYAVIIYENNSTDNTAAILSKWSKENSHVICISEQLPKKDLPESRPERIAKARNIVLKRAKDPKYAGFDYLIMADLDFKTPWPIKEIVKTVNTEGSWDCVSSNGIKEERYWDRYAFRSTDFPFGPEIMGDEWWKELSETWFKIPTDKWLQVYSAFGGLAIFKTASIINCSYSGTITNNLKKFYKKIFPTLSKQNPQLKKYLALIGSNGEKKIPIVFSHNSARESRSNYPFITCCEHVPLFATMFLQGFDKVYVNPQMCMYYN